MKPKAMTWKQFADHYCETQECTPENLLLRLREQKRQFNPNGWFMLECALLDSSRLGERTILPYGPNNTFKTIPTHPVSPRGLASDTATVVAVIPADEV